MEFTTFARHQLRAHGRRRGRAGITITSAGSTQQKWQQHSLRVSTLELQDLGVESRTDSFELLDFLSRTAVDNENQLLTGTWDPGFATVSRPRPPLAATREDEPEVSQPAPPVVASAGHEVSLLGQLADSIFSASTSEQMNDFAGALDFGQLKSLVKWQARDAIAAVGPAWSGDEAANAPPLSPVDLLEAAHAINPLATLAESLLEGQAMPSMESEFELVKALHQEKTKLDCDYQLAWARATESEALEPMEVADLAWQNVAVPVNDKQPIESALGVGNSYAGLDLEMAERLDLPLNHGASVTDDRATDDSAGAFRSMLKELNEWLSASQSQIEELSDESGREAPAVEEAEDLFALSEEIDPTLPLMLQAAFEADPLDEDPAKFADGSYRHREISPLVVPREGKRLRQMFRQAGSKPVKTKVLGNGHRFECYDTGAVVEKDELGRVTQIRAAAGGCVSIYYDRDGNPEGFVRTDKQGRNHSTAACDRQGVIVRDATGRIRAAGDALLIDPNGCLSVCRSDGQFWSIDLVRAKHIERRRLADAYGVWNIVTAVFAADGFRMTTLFQPVADLPNQDQIHSVEDANRVWFNASVARSSFRFYGRDGSVIQFESEDELTNLSPSHVWQPGTRRVEQIWKNRHQAGTAWESVQEYVSSYLSN